MKKYNKLVRDKIPEIIAAKGEKSVTHIADDKEFLEKAREKLSEEVAEFLESENPEELADLLEVIYALSSFLGVSAEELNTIRQQKCDKRGGFEKKIILERS